jgi:Lon protease-like protein
MFGAEETVWGGSLQGGGHCRDWLHSRDHGGNQETFGRRMNIVTEGRERFEVMQLNQERSFLRAEVLYLQDEPGSAPAEKTSQALKLHGEILSLAGAEPEAQSEIDGSKLSFHLAGSLPLDPDFKQTLLGMKSEAERLEGIIAYFEAILPNLQRTVSVRRKSGGNGHV